VNIRAFRARRHRSGPGADVSAVVAPPYDQIDPALQARLHAMHPDNIVRLTFAQDEAGVDRYERSRQVLDRWLADGVWPRDETPAMYPYHQTYSVDGQPVTRRGFVALGEVSEYARGVVLPHERTHAGPKADRMKLMEATRADVGLLFMLVSDPDGTLLQATAPVGEPIAHARDQRGEIHRLWRIDDAAAIERIRALMAPRTVVIADGHHRYETAVAYARRDPAAADKLMAFFSLEAPGLTIFPNHRLVHDVPDFSLRRLLADAARWFDVAPLLDPVTPTPAAIHVVSGADGATLRLRTDAAASIPWPAGTSDAWRRLAVSVLHEAVLKPLLGITDEVLDQRTRVDYMADADEAVAAARAGRYQAAFVLAPTTPEELRRVVAGGEVLPQKSTHFYPKLLDGLVFYRPGED
jgi:uncharacterized protein (DUF1015 family)